MLSSCVPEAVPYSGFHEEALPCFTAVFRFALRLTRGNEAEAEDIAQETFLRAYRRWETYSRGTNCLSWLFTICRHVNTRRNEGKARNAEQLESDLGPDHYFRFERADTTPHEVEAGLFDSFLDGHVVRAIRALPDEFRDAVVLCDLEGMSYEEISGLLGVPGGTVKSRIHRGRRLLYQSLYSYAADLGYVDARAN
jgi:RNA polymerase sigma-70 factor (ECF subfamily)